MMYAASMVPTLFATGIFLLEIKLMIDDDASFSVLPVKDNLVL